MGKRSDFVRVERDFYPTPMSAVLPLIPYLDASIPYCEPCAGNYALVGHITEATSRNECFLACDIEPQSPLVMQKCALEISADLLDEFAVGQIITNPPWDRKILHPMIEHFSTLRPTWLLFDADWVHTRQSAHFMPYLRKIVSVGRVKWIPDSKMTGEDNCAWYLFDQTGVYDGETVFHGRL